MRRRSFYTVLAVTFLIPVSAFAQYQGRTSVRQKIRKTSKKLDLTEVDKYDDYTTLISKIKALPAIVATSKKKQVSCDLILTKWKTSQNNHEIPMVRFFTPDSKSSISLFTSGHHGEEQKARQSLINWTEDLAKKIAADDPQTLETLKYMELWIVPCINVDRLILISSCISAIKTNVVASDNYLFDYGLGDLGFRNSYSEGLDQLSVPFANPPNVKTVYNHFENLWKTMSAEYAPERRKFHSGVKVAQEGGNADLNWGYKAGSAHERPENTAMRFLVENKLVPKILANKTEFLLLFDVHTTQGVTGDILSPTYGSSTAYAKEANKPVKPVPANGYIEILKSYPHSNLPANGLTVNYDYPESTDEKNSHGQSVQAETLDQA